MQRSGRASGPRARRRRDDRGAVPRGRDGRAASAKSGTSEAAGVADGWRHGGRAYYVGVVLTESTPFVMRPKWPWWVGGPIICPPRRKTWPRGGPRANTLRTTLMQALMPTSSPDVAADVPTADSWCISTRPLAPTSWSRRVPPATRSTTGDRLLMNWTSRRPVSGDRGHRRTHRHPVRNAGAPHPSPHPTHAGHRGRRGHRPGGLARSPGPPCSAAPASA